MTVMMAAVTMAILLIAPCTSPIWSARAVPDACEHAPMHNPCAMGSLIRMRRQADSPKVLPNNPVMQMAATVIVICPPIIREISIPTAVVTVLGSMVT